MVKIIKTQPVIWQELDGVRPAQSVRQFRGYSSLDRFSIDRGFFTGVKNLSSNKDMAIKVRPGYSRLGSAFDAKVLGLGAWENDELHAIADGSWKKWSGSAWGSALASSLSTSAHWSFCNFKGGLSAINLIGTNGTDGMKRYDGSSVSSISDAPSGCNYVEQFADRVWCAVGNQLTGSAYRDATDWSTVTEPAADTDYWYAVVETPNGETISAVKAGLSRLTVYKPNSLHELFGYAPSDYSMRIVTLNRGAVNNRCVAVLKDSHYFLHESGAHRYAGGADPSNDFALPVQDIFDSMDADGLDTSCVGTDGRRVYFCVPINQSSAPDTLLEFDPDFGTWYVWEDISPLHVVTMGGNWYIGDDDGQVLQMGGADDNGTAITWSAVSVPFGAALGAQNVRWYKLWIVAEIPSGSSCSVYLSPSDTGDSDWTLVKAITGSAGTKKQKIIIPVSTVANANWVRLKLTGSGPATVHEIDYMQRDLPLRGA